MHVVLPNGSVEAIEAAEKTLALNAAGSSEEQPATSRAAAWAPRGGSVRYPTGWTRSAGAQTGVVDSGNLSRVTNGVRARRELNHYGLAAGFLSNLPAAQAERLLSESIRLDVPAGAVVYREGDAARCFVVVNGLLRSFMSSRDGRQVTFRYGKNGDVMGLASVIGEPLPLTIQAMTTSSIVAFGVDTVRQMLATDPVVARVCAEELTRQLNQALDGVAQSSFHSVRQRLARELLNLAAESDGPNFVVQVSHQELADSIATSREVVTRALHEMQAEGLIETGHDRLVVLLDVTGLAREFEATGRRLRDDQ